MQHDHYMLMARDYSEHAICHRRKIGVVFRYPGFMFLGANAPAVKCRMCGKEDGCPAIHAEVNALLAAREFATHPNTTMYIWAEVPCVACLSFIHEYSKGNCRDIHCLTQASYANQYPRVLTYSDAIQSRLEYAEKLGITIYLHDADELLRPVET